MSIGDLVANTGKPQLNSGVMNGDIQCDCPFLQLIEQFYYFKTIFWLKSSRTLV